MASKRPIVKQIALLSFFPQLALLTGMIFFARWIGFSNFVIPGALMYLAISLPLRFGVPHHHRKGIALFKKGLFEEAFEDFFFGGEEGVAPDGFSAGAG